jgi:hypothetical protein
MTIRLPNNPFYTNSFSTNLWETQSNNYYLVKKQGVLKKSIRKPFVENRNTVLQITCLIK